MYLPGRMDVLMLEFSSVACPFGGAATAVDADADAADIIILFSIGEENDKLYRCATQALDGGGNNSTIAPLMIALLVFSSVICSGDGKSSNVSPVR